MKLAPKTQQKQGDYSGLSTADLLAVIAEKEASFNDQGQQLQVHEKQIQSHVKTIKHRDQYIDYLEEKLRLSIKLTCLTRLSLNKPLTTLTRNCQMNC